MKDDYHRVETLRQKAEAEVVRLEDALESCQQGRQDARYEIEEFIKERNALGMDRDAAVAKAAKYESDWHTAKSEFGTATSKLRAECYAAQDAAKLWQEKYESLQGDFHYQMMTKEK